MDIKEFEKLPIGTVLIYNFNNLGDEAIEVKSSKYSTIYVFGNDAGIICNYKKLGILSQVEGSLSIAPKWIQECFALKKPKTNKEERNDNKMPKM